MPALKVVRGQLLSIRVVPRIPRLYIEAGFLNPECSRKVLKFFERNRSAILSGLQTVYMIIKMNIYK